MRIYALFEMLENLIEAITILLISRGAGKDTRQLIKNFKTRLNQ